MTIRRATRSAALLAVACLAAASCTGSSVSPGGRPLAAGQCKVFAGKAWADASTGAVRWTNAVPPTGENAVVLPGSEVVVSAYSSKPTALTRPWPGRLVAYRAGAAQPVWQDALPTSPIPPPAVTADGLVALDGYDNQLCMMAP